MREIDGFLKYVVLPISNVVAWKLSGCVVLAHTKCMLSTGMTHPQFEIRWWTSGLIIFLTDIPKKYYIWYSSESSSP